MGEGLSLDQGPVGQDRCDRPLLAARPGSSPGLSELVLAL